MTEDVDDIPAQVSLCELRTNLSALVERAARGETIVVTKRGRPVAELRPAPRHARRRLFADPVKGLHVGPAFFEPLDEF